MLDNVQELQLLLREFFIAAMLNPSLKSRFMRELSRFSIISRTLEGLIG